MASPTLQFKRGLFVNLPSLRAGEPGFTTDRSDLYIGAADGNKFFGSHRYWTRENGTNALELKFVDKDGNNGVSLRAPASVSTPVTYTLPEGGGTTGHFLKLGTAGNLEWASVTSGASFDSVTISNSSFTGVSTFSGLIDANGGLNVVGGSTFDDINVTGVGTIASVDISGGSIDGTVIGASSAAAGTFTELAYNNSSTSGVSTVGSLYIGVDKALSNEGGNLTLSNIEAIDSVTKATLEASLAFDPNNFDSLNVSGVGTFGGLLDANGGLNVSGGATVDTLNVTGVSTFVGVTTFQSAVYVANTLYVGGITIDGSEGPAVFGEDISVRNINATGVSTFVGAINANGGVIGNISGNAGTATSLATARTISLSGDLNGSASFDGSQNVTISATIQPNSVALGDDTTGNYVATITGTANEIEVSGSGSETAAVTIGLPNDVVVGTSLSAPTVKVSTIQSSDDIPAITISPVTGAVGVATDLTVNGNLNVLGSTTTVNTETLLVKDSLIEVGLIDDNGNLVPPTSDSNIDVGVVFHYYDTAAKKAAVYWDDSEGKIVFAKEITEANGVLSATSYASVIAGGLEINNECTGGTDTVISCVGGELALSNIVLDGGSF